MAHGAEDYTNIKEKGDIYVLTDVGELAVRLGSPVVFDRRGNVIFYDDFANGLRSVMPTVSGVGAGYSLASTPTDIGGFSCKLDPGTIAGNYCTLAKYTRIPQFLSAGVAFSFQHIYHDAILTLSLYSGYHNYTYFGEVKIDLELSEISIYDNTEGWVLLADEGLDFGLLKSFSHIKLACDLDNNKYSHMFINHMGFNLTGYDMKEQAISTDKYLTMIIKYEQKGTAPNGIYIDSLIITANE